MKRIKKFLPIFLALVMCVTSIQPVCAASGADTEPTYYYNNDFEAEDALSKVGFSTTVGNGLLTDARGNGYVQLNCNGTATNSDGKNKGGNITFYLSNVESGSMFIEVDLATTEAGMPESRFRITESSTNYELFFIQGNSIYKSKSEATNKKNAITTIPTDGTFTKFGVALIVDNNGIITNVDIYQYDKENGTWLYKGTNVDGGTQGPVGKELKDPKHVSIQIRDGVSTTETLLIDNLKVYPVVAQIGDKNYATLQGAITAAVEGDTITLIDDITSESAISLSKGTLDLNGKTLTVSGLTAFSGTNVVDNSSDKTGLLKVVKGNFVFTTDANNTQMPVYNGTDGYVFATISPQEQRNSDVGADIFELVFRPSLGTGTVVNNTLLANGGEAAKISIGIRLEWTDAEGKPFEPKILVYDDTMIDKVYSEGKAFYIKASGVKSFYNVKITPFVQSRLAESIVWNGTTFAAN